MSIQNQLEENQKLVALVLGNTELLLLIEKSIEIILKNIHQEKPLLVCGNGGSSSDAEHIVGELIGRFLKERKAIHAICLSSNSAAVTAWANDYDYSTVFARQVEAHGKKGGILFGISTSGNSKNVILAVQKAKEMNLDTICLTGQGGGELAKYCDLLIDVPSKSTPRIQELHIMIYHYICEKVEELYKG
jgi:D-sedoheptulose 7-phosphate isomerase